uniref:Scaffold protein Nfu/NifU N-terminal domain-containing protein n=1 Tax=Emiliania huxleyi TaxID=2903 RepID=A0A6U8MR33_EMIHU|mmetsp:Transcript_19122/g.55967  ORF Transcript_19122/g.55967 Transcript_19122/m.55967 type:complete len:274 (+) Transcript_19122:57-878(+)
MLRSLARPAAASSSTFAARRPWALAARRLFIQTESTPNPEALKFLPGKDVLESGSRDFRSLKDAQASPLARRLFATEGVTSVFLAADFVTVSKSDEMDWVALKPQIFGAMMDFYASGEPVLSEESGSEELDSLVITDDDSEVVQMIKEPARDARPGDEVRSELSRGVIWYQGAARDADPAVGARGRRRHRLPRLRRRERRRHAADAGLLRRLPVLLGHAQGWHREHAAPLHPGGQGGPRHCSRRRGDGIRDAVVTALVNMMDLVKTKPPKPRD